MIHRWSAGCLLVVLVAAMAAPPLLSAAPPDPWSYRVVSPTAYAIHAWEAPAPVVVYDYRIPARVRPGAVRRQAIHQIPIQFRPNRPGHFYGNTVRRIYYRRLIREATGPAFVYPAVPY